MRRIKRGKQKGIKKKKIKEIVTTSLGEEERKCKTFKIFEKNMKNNKKIKKEIKRNKRKIKKIKEKEEKELIASK